MLSPEYLQSMSDDIVALYEELNQSAIKCIAKRLVKTEYISDASAWQIKQIQQSGAIYNEIIDELSKISGKSKKELRKLFKEASVKSLSYDDEIYKQAGLNPIPLQQSPSMLAVLEAGIIKTDGIISNLTKTTANGGQVAYINATNDAYMKVSSGVFDYQTAIADAIKSSAKGGLEVFYPSGHRDKLDVAIRRATLTGVSQTTGQLTDIHCDEMGCDLVETTAHGGARPSHAVWQGKVFSRSGNHPHYPSFIPSTGYGTGPGLKGWNCRHDFFPFFEGISKRLYTNKELEEMEKPVGTWKDKEYTQYEVTQKQRSYERNLREYKRQLVGLDEGIKNAKDPDMLAKLKTDFTDLSVEMRQYKAEYEMFSYNFSTRPQPNRTQMYADSTGNGIKNYGKSTSMKSVWADRKEQINKIKRNDYINNEKPNLPKVSIANDTILQDTMSYRINTNDKIIEGVIPKEVNINNVRIIAGYGTSSNIKVVNNLVKNYGGKDWKWQKKGGIIETPYRKYDVHWYEYNNKQYESKLKGLKDNEN